MIGAICRVVDTHEEAQKAHHASRQIVVLATLYIKNAFSSARWVDITRVLKDDFRMLTYLMRVLSDYLRNRSLTYDTTDGPKTKDITTAAREVGAVGSGFSA